MRYAAAAISVIGTFVFLMVVSAAKDYEFSWSLLALFMAAAVGAGILVLDAWQPRNRP